MGAGPARGSTTRPGEREEVAVQLRRQRACWRQFVLGGRLQAWSAEAVAALETRMVDESGSGLGGMRVWAHDSAVTHVVLLVPHGPRFGTAPPRDRPGTECFCHSDLQIRRWCKQQEMFTPGRTHSGVFQVCTGCQGCGSGCTSRVHVKGISEFLFACARTCPAMRWKPPLRANRCVGSVLTC